MLRSTRSGLLRQVTFRAEGRSGRNKLAPNTIASPRSYLLTAMVKSNRASNLVDDARAEKERAALRDFLKMVREVAHSRRETLGALRSALQAHDDAAALRLARKLVGLSD